jgi:hypothetical protein
LPDHDPEKSAKPATMSLVIARRSTPMLESMGPRPPLCVIADGFLYRDGTAGAQPWPCPESRSRAMVRNPYGSILYTPGKQGSILPAFASQARNTCTTLNRRPWSKDSC